jgi:hypothetical protein
LAHGSPALFPFELPLGEAWLVASTIVPPSTRTLSAVATSFPPTTSIAACADGDAPEASCVGATIPATSNAP